MGDLYINLLSKHERVLDIMQFASLMYRLLVSPSGQSNDLQDVKQFMCTHDEQTTAQIVANRCIRADRMR